MIDSTEWSGVQKTNWTWVLEPHEVVAVGATVRRQRDVLRQPLRGARCRRGTNGQLGGVRRRCHRALAETEVADELAEALGLGRELLRSRRQLLGGRGVLLGDL